MYYYIFNCFLSNKLFTSPQSGFLSGDSRIAKLLTIILQIEVVFNNNLTIDARGVFLERCFQNKNKSYGVVTIVRVTCVKDLLPV